MTISYVDYYCRDYNKELKKVVNSLLSRHFPWVSEKDYDDFYSLAELVCWDCEKKYDGRKPFDKFLINCLYNKIKTKITHMNRLKRVGDLHTSSLQQSIGDEGEIALQDVIEDVNTVDVTHTLIIESAVATIYALVKPRERKILSLIKNGYSNKEIAMMLNVEPKAVTGLKKKLNENSEVRRAVKRAGYLGGLYDEK